MACIFCDKPCVFFRNAKRLSNIPPCGGNRRGFGCVYAGHFSPCPHVRLRLQRTHCFISRWAASTARVYTRKTHTHLICKDMHGVFRLMFLSNCPCRKGKVKDFFYRLHYNPESFLWSFLSLPAFCGYSHTRIPCQGISYHRRRFRRERQPIRTLQSYIFFFSFLTFLVRHRG